MRLISKSLLLVGIVALGYAPVRANVALMSFSKVFAPDEIGRGSATMLTFTITNNNPHVVTDLAFTDTLPAGVTIASPTNASTTCTAGIVTAVAGGSVISLAGGGVGANGSCTVTVNVTSGTLGTHTNVTGTLTSSEGAVGTATDDLMVSSDRPGFSKAFSPSTVGIGSRSTLTFTIDNTASESAVQDVSFTDSLPPGMVVADPSNASTTCQSPLGIVSLTATPGSSVISYSYNGFGIAPAVAAGATCTVTVDVIGSGVGMLGNVSSDLSAFVVESTVSSGKASAVLTVVAETLTVTKSFTDDPVPPGGTVTLEFTVISLDRDFAATNVAFTDDLDAALTGLVATGLPLSNVCGAGSQISGMGTLSLTGGSLPAGGTCTFSVTLQVPEGAATGAYVNTTSTPTGTIDGSGVVGQPGSDTLFVQPIPILTKAFTDDPVGAGDSVVLHFTITNSSATMPASDVEFIDQFDTVIRTASAGPTSTCGGTATFSPLLDSPGGSVIPATLSLTGGSLAAGASCTIDITLDTHAGAASGGYLNTTSAPIATVGDTMYTGKPASDTLVVVGAPTLTKTFTDDPVQPGSTVTLQFTLTHEATASTDATAITFTDDLADLMPTVPGLVATGLPLNNICGSGSSLEETAANTLLTFAGGTLMPGEVCTFSVTLTVPGGAPAGSHTNTTSEVTATVSGVTAMNVAASDDLLVAGVSLTKSFTDDPVLPGGTVELEFTVQNTSASAATNIAFNDDIDQNLANLVPTGLPMADVCGVGSSLADVGGNTIRLSGGNLVAGESCTFSVTLDVPVGAASDSYLNITSGFQATLGGLPITFPEARDNLVVDDNLLSLQKEFTDDPVVPGGTARLVFTLSNLDQANAASGVAFTDDLDAMLAGTIFNGVSNTCGIMLAGGGTGLLDASGIALPPGGSCTITVDVVVPGGAVSGSAFTNTTSIVTGTVGGLGVVGSPASDDLLIETVTFTKSFNASTIAGGAPVLTFTITNLSTTETFDNLSFTDDLDAVFAGLAATGLPTSNVCGTGSQLAGTTFLALTGGTVGPSASCTFDVTLAVPPTATPGMFANTTSDLTRLGLPMTGPATATLTVLASADLSVTKTESIDPVFAGSGAGNLVYTVTVTNNGPSVATGVTIGEDLTLPAGVTRTSVVASQGTFADTSAPDGTWTVGTLAVSASATLTVTLTVDASAAAGTDVIMNTAAVTDVNEIEVNAGNSSASQVTSIAHQADLSVTKTESIDPVIAGSGAGNLVYTVTVTNSGPSDATGVTVSEDLTLPAGVTRSSVVASSGSFADTTAPDGTWTVGTLAVSASATLTVTLTVDASAAAGTNVISDTASVAGANETLINTGNDSATAQTSIRTMGGVVVTPTSLQIPEGESRTFTVVLTTTPTAGVRVPTAPVTIGLSSSNPSEGTVSPPSLTFTPANALVPQTVTVTAANDEGEDGNATYTVVTAPTVSTDVAFNGLDGPDVAVTNVDDEDTVTLTVDKVGNGGGIVTSSPGGIDCGLDCTEGYAVTRLPAPTVTLTPIPESDASFAGWSGPADCADGVVTPTSDLTCTATFVRLPIGQGAPDSAAVRAPLGSSLRLNGDAFGDVFAYSAASGAWARLLGNGAGALALERLDGWSPGWIVRAARLNADALDDFVLYNQVTGAWFKAVNDGTGGFTYFGSTWSPGWQLFVMDLDGNGLSDVLVYDPLTGAWFRGVNVGPADFVYTAGRWDPSWEVHPVEINGDGRTDLFLHNAASGTYYQAINNGVNDFTCNADGRSCQLEPLTVPTWSPGWQVTPAEFNNDGRSDLFLYNPTTGAYFIGLATGMTAPLEAYTFQGGTWSPGWTVRAGDFNADALADIFVYNVDTGAWFMELNNGAGGFTDHQGQPWSPGWQLYVVEAGGDGRSDLLLYSQATGQWYQAVTTGPGTFSYVTGFFDPDATVVAEVPIVP